MKLKMTNAVRKALEDIKKRMIAQFSEKDLSKYKIKFTKKKEFLAVPINYSSAAFQLFLNDKFYKSYFLKNDKWKEF